MIISAHRRMLHVCVLLVALHVASLPSPTPDENGTEDIAINLHECPDFELEYESIVHYLNPEIFEDPQTIQDIAATLQNDQLVVIRNAFIPEFAEAMHCNLDRLKGWELFEGTFDDGFAYHHHNIYDEEKLTPLILSAREMMIHPVTKSWMSKLAGRDCNGDGWGAEGSASWYWPGDHSLPHSDFERQRTVAFVWHLSKNWDPEWGGALYWSGEPSKHAFVHASFNTLSLFNVRADSHHFVTAVNSKAEEKRLSFNGWFTSDWVPSLEDEYLEERLSTPEQRWGLSALQAETLREIVLENNDESFESDERRENLIDLVNMAEDQIWWKKADNILLVNTEEVPQVNEEVE